MKPNEDVSPVLIKTAELLVKAIKRQAALEAELEWALDFVYPRTAASSAVLDRYNAAYELLRGE